MDPGLTKVVIATQHLRRDGGVGVHVLRMADALRSQGREVYILADEVDPDADGAGVHQVPGLKATTISPAVKSHLERLLTPIGRPVVFHVHHLHDGALIPLLRLFGPVVWSVHEYSACPTGNYYFQPGHECHRAHGPGCIPHIALHGCAHTWDPRSLPARYRRSANRIRTLRDADAVIAYSGFVARHLRRNRIPGVTVAPLIIPHVPGWAAPEATTPRILFAGRLAPYKGLGTLLRAAGRLDAEVDVVGSGWWGAAAEREAADAGVADRVTFHGWQAADALDAFYRMATVVAVPSLWPEPFGMVGPEAMSHGRPVVASDTGGIPEWLEHGRTGLLVPPGDEEALASALASLLANPQVSRQMGERGAARVRARYSPGAHVAVLDDLHGRLLSEPPTASDGVATMALD